MLILWGTSKVKSGSSLFLSPQREGSDELEICRQIKDPGKWGGEGGGVSPVPQLHDHQEYLPTNWKFVRNEGGLKMEKGQEKNF